MYRHLAALLFSAGFLSSGVALASARFTPEQVRSVVEIVGAAALGGATTLLATRSNNVTALRQSEFKALWDQNQQLIETKNRDLDDMRKRIAGLESQVAALREALEREITSRIAAEARVTHLENQLRFKEQQLNHLASAIEDQP